MLKPPFGRFAARLSVFQAASFYTMSLRFLPEDECDVIEPPTVFYKSLRWLRDRGAVDSFATLLIFIEEMISADVNRRNLKHRSKNPAGRSAAAFVFLNCISLSWSSDSTWGGRSSLWFWEQPSEAALGSVVVTDLNRANVGGRLFPYGSLFSSTLGRLGSENLLPLLSSPTSSVQCEAVTQLRDKFCKPGYFNHHNLIFKLYSFFESAAFLYFI